ncbi:TetR/AcrR family transcriptional regulator [Streptomyces sp. VRA16 Mangrove soil]|uniref:TetR/AcrR family transcriptional regulator n=1 Tax=Streptomyces sp. VRA16 Mangrove soil TaxID=2817434 RepID=UPI001E41B2C9|nr:TetR/AcrR family transcriptional regulator [Streptomyces sp. VRA16 Mangrove soil]
MPEPAPHPDQRPARAPRADVRRNREKLLAAARSAFTAADTAVPLESIARAAGVGIGTLYRHFPTREALVEAVYAAELDAVTESAASLLEELPPEAALRAWMDRYAELVSAKRGMIGGLGGGWAPGRGATVSTRERLTGAIGALLEAGGRAGTLRQDVDPDDVITLLLGVFLSTAAGDRTERTRQLLDLVADALRAPGPPPA